MFAQLACRSAADLLLKFIGNNIGEKISEGIAAVLESAQRRHSLETSAHRAQNRAFVRGTAQSVDQHVAKFAKRVVSVNLERSRHTSQRDHRLCLVHRPSTPSRRLK